MLADLVGPGTRFVAAAGGRGGLGNAALASAARKAPGFALLGEPGETRDLVLELQIVADVGLVGFPSAGKSSLVAALSAARPKIADYPFTTLVPNLGVVTAGEEVFTVADVPGLIPGAAEGRGLGLEFLRHIERCSVLVHVVDCATFEPGRDPVSDIEALEDELARYTPALGGELADRPRLVALNKIDVPDARELAEIVRRRPGRAVRLAGVRDLDGHPRGPARADVRDGRSRCATHRAAQPVAEPTRIVLRPPAVDDAGFTVEPDPRAAGRVHRARRAPGALDPADRTSTTTRPSATWPTGWPGSASRTRWPRRGAVPGCPVTIGDVTFDWEPTHARRGRGACCPGAAPTGGWSRAPARRRGGPAGRPHRRGAGHRTRRRARSGDAAEDGRVTTGATGDRAAQLGGGRARVVVKVGSSSLTSLDRRAGPGPARRARRRARRPARRGHARSCWCRPARSRPGWPRSGWPAARATSPPSRRPRPSASCCSPRPTRRRSPGTASAIGQVLLTADDMIRRAHYRNAQRTLERLLGLDVLPVVNENDTVATDEIRFGDNDRLAALVAHIVGADGLVLLSDVDGPLRRRSAPGRVPAGRRGRRRPRTWRR